MGIENVFEEGIQKVLAHEGGYVNNPNDPGGETNFGISKRSFPDLDIKNLTKEEAIDIYRREYWEETAYPQLAITHPQISIKMLDFSINMGQIQANKLLQRACRCVTGRNIKDDGYIGPLTLDAIKSCSPGMLLVSLKSEAAGYYRVLVAQKSSNVVFLKGWLNRAYE